MTSTNELSSQPTPAPASAGKTIAQLVAVVVAVAVVSYLVWDAQANADQELQLQNQPHGAVVPAGTPEASPHSLAVDPNQVLLPSSKFRVINDAAVSLSNGSNVTLSGSKSGVLPSSKFLVLPSPKSGPPMRDENATPFVTSKPTLKQLRKPVQTVVPTQTGGGNKD